MSLFKYWSYVFLVFFVIIVDFKFNFSGIFIITIFVFLLLNKKDIKLCEEKINSSVILNCISFIVVFFLTKCSIQSITFPVNLSSPNIEAFDFVKIILIYPILEEYLFRGFFLNRLIENYNSLTVLLVISLGFTFLHFLNGGYLYIFVYSYFVTKLTLEYKNLLIVIILHSLYNSLSLFSDFVHNFLVQFNIKYILILLIAYIYILYFNFKKIFKKIR